MIPQKKNKPADYRPQHRPAVDTGEDDTPTLILRSRERPRALEDVLQLLDQQ